MIVKFLKNKKGGSSKSIDYLLDKKRVENGTARILSGDEKSTRLIIDSMTKKQKVSFGVLSFEEKNISEEQKKYLMEETEKTLLCGLEKQQYNILWVEHTDKDRLELNFIIPKVELSTGRALNPYNHKTDLHIKDLFQQKMNLKFAYSDPDNPKKQNTIQGSKKKIHLIKDYELLDELLHDLVSKNEIQSREQLIKMLKDSNIKVKRAGKDYISVKLPDSKIANRFRGGIYDEQFTSNDGLSQVIEQQRAREQEYDSRDIGREFREVSERLEKAVGKRTLYNQEKFAKPKNNQREFRQKIESTEPKNKEVREQELLRPTERKIDHDRIRRDAKSRVESRTRANEQTISELRRNAQDLYLEVAEHTPRRRAIYHARQKIVRAIKQSERNIQEARRVIRVAGQAFKRMGLEALSPTTTFLMFFKEFKRWEAKFELKELEKREKSLFETVEEFFSQFPDSKYRYDDVRTERESWINIYAGHLNCEVTEVKNQPIENVLRVESMLKEKVAEQKAREARIAKINSRDFDEYHGISI